MDSFYRWITVVAASVFLLTIFTIVGCSEKKKRANKSRRATPVSISKKQASSQQSQASLRTMETPPKGHFNASVKGAKPTPTAEKPKPEKSEKSKEKPESPKPKLPPAKVGKSPSVEATQPSQKNKSTSQKTTVEMNSVETLMPVACTPANLDETQASTSPRCLDNADTDEFFDELHSDVIKSEGI
ncbi:hypothetical protein L596_021607 [Steinernema carpocapsae]|uniref:Uncharacterized protein n=1 Tax=Steinernema carpocapsae TaxID=34508 RepID=A0A4V5ZZY7_STECR|nr:hypothetical protein L596_021607 [Steinernema carpocapsae]